MRLMFAIILTGSVLTASACGGTSPAAKAQALTVTGSVQTDGITWRDGARVGESCTPDAGTDDLTGAQVVVADDAGKTLAIGKVAEGKFTKTSTGAGLAIMKGPCSFGFKVANVPAGLAFYTVTVGSRGSQKISGSEIAQPLDLTLR
jgi:hypothetical protein